jgi:tetratricopeptide (TPR) repeat protein
MRPSAHLTALSSQRPWRTIIAAALGATAGAIFALAASAWAQDTAPENRSRQSSARTSVGAPLASLCATAAAEGRSDDEAAAACDQAVVTERLNRSNVIATQMNRGAIHLRRREAALALDAYDALLALDDEHAEAHMSRGIALQMLGRPGPAVAAITEALGLGVSQPHMAYYYRAAARESLGDVRGAYEDYRTALDIEPNWGPAFEELARFARVRRDELVAELAEGDSETATEQSEEAP